MPNNDADLERELQFAKPEGGGKKLVELLQLSLVEYPRPAQCLRRRTSANIVPEKAEAALDVRLVKGEDPDKKFEQVLRNIRKQGFYVTFGRTYKGRTPFKFPCRPCRQGRLELSCFSDFHGVGCFKSARSAGARSTGGSAVIAPTLGGSVQCIFSKTLVLPWIGVPIVNYDNHQHSSDENLRLGQFLAGDGNYGTFWRI